MKIFLSSTSDDLTDHRSVLIRALSQAGHGVIAMEHFPASASSPSAYCRSRVAEADLVVVLVAWRYGLIPPNDDRSMTEMEFDTAESEGKPILAFLARDDSDWAVRFIDRGKGAEAVDRLRHRILDSYMAGWFSTADSAAHAVLAAVAKLEAKSSPAGTSYADVTLEWALTARLSIAGFGVLGSLDLDVRRAPVRIRVEPASRRMRSLVAASGGFALEIAAADSSSVDAQAFVDEWAASNSSVAVVLGDPGSGKTTFLRQVFVVLANGRSLDKASALPVLIHARSLTWRASLHEWESALATALEVEGLPPETATGLRGSSGEVPFVAIIDGLDELGDDDRREAFAVLRRLASAPRHRVLVSCRVSRYGRDEFLGARARHYEIVALTTIEALSLVDGWFTNVGTEVTSLGLRLPPGSSDLDSVRMDVYRIVEQPPSRPVAQIVTNPLTLTLLCFAAIESGHVARSPFSFFERAVQALLEKWTRSRGYQLPCTVQQASRCISHLAYEAQRGSNLVKKELLLASMQREDIDSGYLDQMLSNLVDGAGLLSAFGDDFEFVHTGLREYLAAAHIARHPDTWNRLAADALTGRWREVVTLLLAQADFRLHGVLLNRILSHVTARDLALVEHYLFAALGADPSAVRESVDGYHADTVVRMQLNRVVGVAKPAGVEPAVNVARPGPIRPCAREPLVLPAAGIKLLHVPEGKVRLGPDVAGVGPLEAETAHVAEFWMSQSPVTNDQYARFVRATGYRETPFWLEERFGAADQPVVGVSWYDSSAYCAWVAQTENCNCRLPTESEWVYGARSDDARRYPWGDTDPSPNHACFNVPELRPSVVGSHPLGEGPFGLLDQAGLVWEWCLDVWRRETYAGTVETQGDPGALRVVRGGTWWYSGDALDLDYRFRQPPGNQNDDIGFRPVVVT